MNSKFTALGLICGLLCLGTLSACGDAELEKKKKVTPTNNANPDMGDMGDDMEDMTQEEPPASLTINPNPARALYVPGANVGMQVNVLDEMGNPLDMAQVNWTITPADAVTEGDEPNKWVIGQQEGSINFEACTVALNIEGNPVCNSIDILVDAGPPTITITSPMPGAEISLADADKLVVTGTITDTFGDVTAFLNDQQLQLDGQGNFTIELEPTFGINHIAIEATDGHQLVGSKQELDVLWAPEFYKTDDATDVAQVTWPDGLVLRLGQQFIDDRVPPAVTPQGAALTEDLADVLTLLLRNIDIGALITNPVLDSDDVKLSITKASLGETNLQINITEDGLELFVKANNVSVDTQGQLTLIDQTLDLTGNVSAAASLLAEIKLEKASAADPFKVEIVRVGVAIEEANSQFADAQANAIFKLAQSALRSNIESILVDALEMSFINAVPALLEDALNSLESAIAMQTFDLDTGLGAPITIDFQGKIDGLDITAQQDITLNVEAVMAAKTMPIEMSRGVAVMAPYMEGKVPFLDTSRIQIGIRLGVLNGLLHSLWRGGLLNLDVSALLPDGLDQLVSSAVITGKLPPVIRPPYQGEPYDLILDVGQLQLQADFGADRVTYGVSMSAGISTSIVNNELVINVAPKPIIRTWIIETTTNRPRLNADQLRTVLLEQVWPLLTDAIGMGLSLSLPVLDLSDINTYAPALQNFALNFVQVRPLVLVDDFLVLDTNLRGTLPPPPMQ